RDCRSSPLLPPSSPTSLPASRPAAVFAPWRRIAALLAAERERWSLWAPVGLGAGIALYFALPAEPPAWLGPVWLGLALLLAVWQRDRQGALIAALAVALVGAGLAVAQGRTAQVAAPILAADYGPGLVAGQLLSIEPGEAGEPGGGRVVLGHPRLTGLAAEASPVRVRIRLTARDPIAPRVGDWIELRAALRPPPEPAAPGAFDFARQAYFQRLGAVGYAVGHARPIDPPAEVGTASAWAPLEAWRLWWSGLRQQVTERVLQALPGRAGALAAALMTGERAAIPQDVIEAMRDSGLAHLLAISGLHLGLVAGLLFFAVRAALALVPPLALEQPIKKWAAVAAACGAFAYLMLVGATVPAQRAFVMVALVLLAVLTDRAAISLRLVAWAAAGILLLAPESLLSASFQMSFAAVTALVAAYEVIGRSQPRAFVAQRGLLARGLLYLAGVTTTSVIAIAATAPFAIYHFNRMAWYGLAANIVAVPLTAFWIMPCALVAFCLMPFGLERLALVPMGRGSEAVIATAERVTAWPGAVAAVPAMPAAGLALVVLGGLWLCLWRRPWRLAGFAGIAAGFAGILLTAPPDILASGDGKLLAVRAADGRLWLSTRRSARFTADIWLRRAGQAKGEAWPRAGPGADGALVCDPLGCVFHLKGQNVALVRDGRALDEDCRRASVLISLEPVANGRCPAPGLIVDRFDLWREGTHALWLDSGVVRSESVARVRGDRPWAPRRGRWPEE
ncbi:MAG: ComEC/Rec2 family competence protein, partial [Kiloniellales bacterium]